MTSISLRYKKSTTGEEQPPTKDFHVTYTRPDGQSATDSEIYEITTAFNRAMAKAGEESGETSRFIEPEWAHEGYQIEVARDDGLPLSIHDVQFFIFMDTMRRNPPLVEVEVITISKATHALLSELPAVGAQTWAAAIQQLAPDREEQEGEEEAYGFYEQVVTLDNVDGAQLLLDVGLITRHDANQQNQYVVHRDAAHCKIEWRKNEVV